MNFGENEQLFGFDPTPAIVAVEFADGDMVDVFLRESDGTTRLLQERFSPYLWLGASADGVEELEGNLPLKYLAQYNTWDEYLEARSNWQRAGEATFSLNDPVQQYLTVSGRTLFKGMVIEDLRRLQFAMTTEGDAITSIALGDNSGWEEVVEIATDSVESERSALEWLTRTIQERDPDIIEGHNLFKSTLTHLAARAKKLKVKLAWGRQGEPLKSRSSRLQIAEKAIQYARFTARGRHIVDTWVLAQYYDISSRELSGFDLQTVATHFALHEKGVEGALRDVRETRAVAGLLSRSYFIQAQIFPYNYQDVIVRGNATKIDALFLREYRRRGHSLPDFPEPRHFEGGYTDIFKTGIIEDVWHCDVTSLYPSVMLAFGFLPQNDALGMFRGLLQDLRTFRVQAKNELRQSTCPVERTQLDTLQSTFKILINSFYGYLGFAQGHFADFTAAEAVTAKGREILRQMVEWLNSQGATVIEIDTDGIYFHPPTEADAELLHAGLAAELPAGIEVEFDERYRAMFSYKAKNYALLAEDGTMHLKGAALKSRGMEPFLRDYMEQFVRFLLEGEPQQALALKAELSEQLRARSLPIEALAKTEALQDSLASYQKKIGASSRNRSAAFELAIKSGEDYQAGDQVSYYVTGTKKKVVAYENARLVSEWNAEDRDENVEYYVGKLDDLAKKFAEFASDPPEPELF